MLEIDGSYLEGGGQILRTSIGLSALAGKPCKIYNIRKNRPRPGLAAQHLTGIKAVAEICDAGLKGAELGSTEVESMPGKINPGNYAFDVGTAGSVTLVLQALLIPAVGSGKKFSFEIRGGTDVSWSPTTDYFQNTFCDFMEKLGAYVSAETPRHGFYPKGGGKVLVKITPSGLKPVMLAERGKLQKTDVRSIASESLRERKAAERQLEGFRSIIKPDAEAYDYVPAPSPGTSLHSHAHFSNCKLGASSIGERGKRAEQVGEEAARLLKKQIDSGACLDEWMADQTLSYLAIAAEKGPSTVSVAEITKHALTNIWVIEKFLPVKFSVKGREGEPGVISVEKT